MASEDTNSSTNQSSSSWWGSFVKSAKEKSINAFEIMKNDLAEFTSTMTNDTSNLLNQASAQLIETTNQTILNKTSLFKPSDQSSSHAIAPMTMSQSKSNLNKINSSPEHQVIKRTTVHDRFKNDLKLLQSNESTYLNDPKSDLNEEFAEWQNNFNPDNFKASISDLLIENSSMRLLYSQLVPAQISNNQFWCRYFFKVNMLEEEHKKRVKLIERASAELNEEKKESIDWEDDNESELEPFKELKIEKNDNNNDSETDTLSNENIVVPLENNKELNMAVNTSEPSYHASKELNTPETNGQSELMPIDSNVKNLILEKNTQNSKERSDNIYFNQENQIEIASLHDPNLDHSHHKLKNTSESNSNVNKDEKLELSQKTEDSDEWEKVSDVALNENETDKKKNHYSSDESISKKEKSFDETKKENSLKTKTQDNSGSSKLKLKTDSENNKNDDDWDDWD